MQGPENEIHSNKFIIFSALQKQKDEDYAPTAFMNFLNYLFVVLHKNTPLVLTSTYFSHICTIEKSIHRKIFVFVFRYTGYTRKF